MRIALTAFLLVVAPPARLCPAMTASVMVALAARAHAKKTSLSRFLHRTSATMTLSEAKGELGTISRFVCIFQDTRRR